MRREETLPGYITCSASEALLHLLRNPNFHRTSTNRQGTFFLKTRVTLSTLSLPVLVILHFIIFLTTKTNFPNILSSFRGSRLHYTHFLQRKPLLLSRPSQPVWFYQHIINLLQINHKKHVAVFVFQVHIQVLTSWFTGTWDSVQIKTMLLLSHTNYTPNCT